jgi:hypothetical protein
MSPFLATLWVTGAAVYLFGTMLFTNAVNFFGTEEPRTSVPEIGRSVEFPKVVSVEAKNAEQAKAQYMVNPERRRAISPDQPFMNHQPLRHHPPHCLRKSSLPTLVRNRFRRS